jgi:hypothetical protein
MLTFGSNKKFTISVVIPAFKVSRHIGPLLKKIPDFVDFIIVVDDACPEDSGKVAERFHQDKRIKVVYHKVNKGVGGAVKTGYTEALSMKSDVIVKIDGDGQMDPSEMSKLISPLIEKGFNYAKGNRFFYLENIRKMPLIRVFGNIILSFMSKISTGYYEIFDPNNGYTAITSETISKISLKNVDDRYFFESDMLFQLNLARAKVVDVPISPIYGDENSNLKIRFAVFTFFINHMKNFMKRISYSYFIRDFNIASLQLISGLILFTWGLVSGLSTWFHSMSTGLPSQTGTLILVAILIVSGIQLLLSFINNDMASNKSIN